jgi:hypothetical protein
MFISYRLVNTAILNPFIIKNNEVTGSTNKIAISVNLNKTLISLNPLKRIPEFLLTDSKYTKNNPTIKKVADTVLIEKMVTVKFLFKFLIACKK